MADVTVAIPVGPEKHHLDYLAEAYASVCAQTILCNILIINDMNKHWLIRRIVGDVQQAANADIINIPTVWDSPWRLGVAHAFNFGVALAQTECVIMLGADDTLEPEAAERCYDLYENTPERWQGAMYYGMPVRYMDTGEVQDVPCGGAMVTKSLWKLTGGFPTETASGASDAAFLSQIWNRHDIARWCMVGRQPLYNYRRHANTDTAARGRWQGVILETRGLLTEEWRQPTWERF